jgi:hypothetical protein
MFHVSAATMSDELEKGQANDEAVIDRRHDDIRSKSEMSRGASQQSIEVSSSPVIISTNETLSDLIALRLKKRTLGFMTLSVFLILIALLLSIFLGVFINNTIEGIVVIDSEDSPLYDGWVEGKASYVDFFWFDYQNPDAFIGGAPPEVVEKGPYSFNKREFRFDIRFDADADQVTYKQQDYFVFEPTRSIQEGTQLSPSDMITTLNLPLFSIIAFGQNPVFQNLLDPTPDSDPPVQRNATGLLRFLNYIWFAGVEPVPFSDGTQQTCNRAVQQPFSDGNTTCPSPFPGGLAAPCWIPAEDPNPVQCEGLFLRRNVSQLLFGHTTPTLDSIVSLLKQWNPFLFFAVPALNDLIGSWPGLQANQTRQEAVDAGDWSVTMGTKDITRIRYFNKWNGKTESRVGLIPGPDGIPLVWNNSVPGKADCNTVKGFTGTQFEPERVEIKPIPALLTAGSILVTFAAVALPISHRLTTCLTGTKSAAISMGLVAAGIMGTTLGVVSNQFSFEIATPLRLTKPDIFVPPLQRSFQVTADQVPQSDYKGITVDTFRIPPSEFQNAALNPENAAYYMYADVPQGILPIDKLQGTMPLSIAKAHFLDAGPELPAAIEGFAPPNRNDHETSLLTEPITGAVIKANQRLQTNYLFQPLTFDSTDPATGLPDKTAPQVTWFQNIAQPIYLPLFWLDQNGDLTDDQASTVQNELNLISSVQKSQELIRWIGSGLGLLSFFVGVYFFVALLSMKRNAATAQPEDTSTPYVETSSEVTDKHGQPILHL